MLCLKSQGNRKKRFSFLLLVCFVSLQCVLLYFRQCRTSFPTEEIIHGVSSRLIQLPISDYCQCGQWNREQWVAEENSSLCEITPLPTWNKCVCVKERENKTAGPPPCVLVAAAALIGLLDDVTMVSRPDVRVSEKVLIWLVINQASQSPHRESDWRLK